MEPNQPNQATIVLKQIWPTVYRIINGSVYFLLSTTKAIIKACIEQIKGSI
jgi:hypothetical protein